MPENYYDDSSGATSITDDTAKPKTPEQRDREQDKKTALVPMALCPGLKPGDTLNLRVASVHEDEYEVEYDEGNEEKASVTPAKEAREQSNQPSMGGYMED